MKPEEIRNQTDDELERLLEDLQEELFNLRFRQATQDLENPLRIRLVRRDIARIKTILKERQSGRVVTGKVGKEQKGETQGKA